MSIVYTLLYTLSLLTIINPTFSYLRTIDSEPEISEHNLAGFSKCRAECGLHIIVQESPDVKSSLIGEPFRDAPYWEMTKCLGEERFTKI